MNTLIGLGLAAVVLLAVVIRRALGKRSDVRQKDRLREETAKRDLEQDRLDCLELARGLDRPLDGAVRPAPADAAAVSDRG